MSFSKTLQEKIESHIKQYIKKISAEFNVDESQLLAIWTGEKTTSSIVNMEDLSVQRLSNCTKPELAALCKSRGLKCTGTKDELKNRLLGKDDCVKPEKKEKEPPKSKPKGKDKSAIIEKLTSNVPLIPIRRNKHGNYEHPESSFIFDKVSQLVIGKQEDDGSVSELTEDDIETCKKYKFHYRPSKNLDKDNLEEVNIEEINEEDIVEDEDVVEDDTEAVEEDEEEEIIEDDD